MPLRHPTEASADITHCIGAFYNTDRLHSTLGYRSPADYARAAIRNPLSRCPLKLDHDKALLSTIRARGCQAMQAGAGMYLWVAFGEGGDALALADILRADGMLLALESAFSSDGVGQRVRLNVARTDDTMLDRIAAAVAMVAVHQATHATS